MTYLGVGERLITKDKRRARPYQSLSRYNRKGRKLLTIEVIHCCWCCGYISLQEKYTRKGKTAHFYSPCVAFTKRLSLGKTNKSFLCWANLFHFGCTIQVSHLDVQIRLAAVFSFSLVCQSSANVLTNAHLQ